MGHRDNKEFKKKQQQQQQDGVPPVRDIAAVKRDVKLPQFWAGDPQVWFAQVESLFATRGIRNQEAKFHHVISSLSSEYASEVRDLILTPPADTPFDTLKTRLVQRTQISEQKRVRLLLSEEELGDRQPTQLLRRMQQLLGEHHMDEQLFRELFVARLPHIAQQVLATCHETLPLSELAAMADRILAVTTSHAVNLVQHSATSAMQDAITAPQEQVTSLTTAVERMAKNSQRGRSRTRSQPRSRAPSPANPGTCFYHARFRDKAHRCEGACTYKASGNAPARQ